MRALFIIFILSLFIHSSAFADEAHQEAFVVCDAESNSFLVRFGLRWNEDTTDKTELAKAPSELNKFWSSKLPSDACELNGKRIEVSTFLGPAFPYGMGGGDAPAFFKLRIDDGDVYYAKTFYRGRGTGEYPVAAVYFKDKKLLECPASVSISDCKDVTARLTQAKYSEDELIAFARDRKRAQLEGNLSSFCQAFPKAQKMFNSVTRLPNGGGFYSKYSVDLDNDGKPDEVILVGDTTGYFDGSYLMLFKDPKKIPAFLEKPEIEIEAQGKAEFSKELNAYFVSIGQSDSSSRYVYNEPVIYNDKTYIVATESNPDRVPSQVVGEMRADHTLNILCQFP
ncbi:MAG: hypothetical protein DI586_10700 [Micavibrio aeruginosavorus]|uniref:Uncharacterized protein n=1 Tax=Micavibrio aeruginosavorus TaxID=349221 RepID=A0A2W5FJ47_9BACT|nr:MAG: hypothetical protein DI586_10700 [Micavibrio aeruginosavorus]